MSEKINKILFWGFIQILIIFILTEVILQVADFPRKSMLFSNINNDGYNRYIRSKDFHHDYRPSQIFYRWSGPNDEFGTVYNEINPLGFRGLIPEPNSVKQNILLLGDSFLEADEIHQDSTVGAFLQRKYPQITFIQKGMSSWSPLLEWNWYNKLGRELKPKKVFLFLCINDFYDGSQYEFCDEAYEANIKISNNSLTFDVDESENDNKIMPWYYNSKVVCLLKLFSKYSNSSNSIFKNSKQFSEDEINQLLNMPSIEFDNNINMIIDKKNPVRIELINFLRLSKPYVLWDSVTAKRVSRSFFWIDKLKENVENTGGRLYIGFLPLGWNISLSECVKGRAYYGFNNVILPMGGIQEQIILYCSNNNITFLPIEQQFKKAASINQLLFLKSDGHLNAKGHQFLSEIISDIID